MPISEPAVPSAVFTKPDELTEVYLVGGAVRDLLLQRSSDDLDFVVVGESADKMKSLGYLPVGADFPVFLHPQTKDEYALARTERKSGHGYAGFETHADENVSLEEDLARRDLTINSMAMDESGHIFDPFNGQKDLQARLLKHTTKAFEEDPVRVLRVARFLARFGPTWSIHPDTKALMQKMQLAGELEHLVAERVWKEMERALMEPYPYLFFETLVELGLFPELNAMHGVPQPKQHHPEGDVFIHTMLVLQRAADLQFDLATRFAALCHDFGKPVAFKKQSNLHGHEALGLAPIADFCERYKVPKKLAKIAQLTAEYHTHCHRINDLKPASIQRLLIENFDALKQPMRFRQFLNACLCDSQGRGPTLVNKPYHQADIALSYLSCLESLDAKRVVRDAIAAGKKGKDLGEALRLAQIASVASCDKEKSGCEY
jgi:tRNA nucleotidyltransferase (CCA-adding enzyme)